MPAIPGPGIERSRFSVWKARTYIYSISYMLNRCRVLQIFKGWSFINWGPCLPRKYIVSPHAIFILSLLKLVVPTLTFQQLEIPFNSPRHFKRECIFPKNMIWTLIKLYLFIWARQSEANNSWQIDCQE